MKQHLLIQTGEYLLPIEYQERIVFRALDKADPRNAISVFVRIDSSFVLPDGLLCSFFESKGRIPEVITNETPERVVIYFYRILDELVSAILIDPLQALRGLQALAKVTKSQLGIHFQNYFCGFAEFLALQEGNPDFHRQLLTTWSDMIESDEVVTDEGRSDLFILDFLFLLIIKSMYITKDLEFGESVRKFILAYVQTPYFDKHIQQLIHSHVL
jgi:hypothetical protein